MKLKQIEKFWRWPKTAIDQDALRARPCDKSTWRTGERNLGARLRTRWKQLKTKRRKTGYGGAKKNEKGNILERQELVVQRMSSEVSGKAQKYTRVLLGYGPASSCSMMRRNSPLKGSKRLARNISCPHWNAKDCPVMFWPVSRGHLVTQWSTFPI